MIPLVKEEFNNSVKMEIDIENNNFRKTKKGSIIAMDEQHSRSQRAYGIAPHCSAVVMSHTTNKILSLNHADEEETKKLHIKCKAKASRILSFKDIADKLDCISYVVVDGCASVENSVKKYINSRSKHNNVMIKKDLWHKCKLIGKDWKSKTNERTKLYGPYKYPTLQTISSDKIKRHFSYCSEICGGSKDKFIEVWNGGIEHFMKKKEIRHQSEEAEILKKFFEKHVDDIEYYDLAYRTFQCESFHHLTTKYCPKGVSFSFNIYKMRKSLAALDWNENYGKKDKTYRFRDIVMKKISERFK